ncbi:mitochondrial Acyl-CoA Thioesterase [Histoplasma capsulatum G186AR]|uniref:Mitochondrial Acyl-CoA Thioesterase n=2 Tax=Ajellomyces capsulatus TaxID=5037 RepID=C0NIS3_AJECG|nr:mitochondrial Acyl-CoA Thioesterase [Histoplasma capsulatum G186AR]EEH08793.1 mitochondrial Acyl-CoA Thioesterase [Histoplasma capsulatum G186AR]
MLLLPLPFPLSLPLPLPPLLLLHAQSQLQFAQAGARARGVAAAANAIKAPSTTSSWHGMAQRRQLHLTPACHTFRPVWTERRVKMPWVEALELEREKEREREREKAEAEAGVDAGVERRGGASLPKVDLQPRKMGDSYSRGILPLAQDPWLLDTYLNASGHIRLGSLLMDLDALAGVVAYAHTGDSVMTVTAAVDRITIEHTLKEICDLELSGQVTYATGRSSMEISLQVAKAPVKGQPVKEEDVLITCAFTMVSLDPVTKMPVAVAPLLVETDEERRLFELGEKNYKAKKQLRTRSLLQQTPNDEESDLIHAMWTKEMAYLNPQNPLARPKNLMHMKETILKSAQIMQPQYRNRHNFMIFGGYLLKQTFELAFCCAASFSNSRPTFLSLDPSTFDNPVPVGSVLYLKATVSYTDPPITSMDSGAAGNGNDNSVGGGGGTRKFTKVQVRVDSKVRDAEHTTKKPTGVFHYTFLVEKDVQVMPQSYSDFMIWVDAKRRAQNTNKSLLSGIMEKDSLDGIQEGVTE